MPSPAPPNPDLALRASDVFSPAAPIHERDVFAGRTEQLRMVIDAVRQRGQHALVYGERGVGKTSLANVVAGMLAALGPTPPVVTYVNCDGTDDFASVWRKVFKRVQMIEERTGAGFKPRIDRIMSTLAERFEGTVTPHEVLSTALVLSAQRSFVPIIDEFDRMTNRDTTRMFTDTIKALSDQCPGTTLILLGIADSVDQLVAEHRSIERALVQVRMPRMSRGELREIIARGVHALGMKADAKAIDYVAILSQGLPHYTHLLGLHATRQAIDAGSWTIRVGHVDGAIRKAVDGAQETLQQAYHTATSSARSDSLFGKVLLACALAKTDRLGYFAATDVRRPLARIMGKPYQIAAFTRHLGDFCAERRGPVLERTGPLRRYRFRFQNPLLQPFVIMQGLAEGEMTRADLNDLTE